MSNWRKIAEIQFGVYIPNKHSPGILPTRKKFISLSTLVKSASSHRKTNAIQFHFYEVPAIIISERQKVGWCLSGLKGLVGGRGDGKLVFIAYKVSI